MEYKNAFQHKLKQQERNKKTFYVCMQLNVKLIKTKTKKKLLN